MKSYTIREVEARNEAGEALTVPERVLLDIMQFDYSRCVVMIGDKAWQLYYGEFWYPAGIPTWWEKVLHYTADGVYDNAATGAAAAKRKRGG